jgi:hypothetical protein
MELPVTAGPCADEKRFRRYKRQPNGYRGRAINGNSAEPWHWLLVNSALSVRGIEKLELAGADNDDRRQNERDGHGRGKCAGKPEKNRHAAWGKNLVMSR